MIDYTDELRARIAANLATHERRDVAPDDRRRAAVAIVVVDSNAAAEAADPFEVTNEDLVDVPGDTTGLGTIRLLEAIRLSGVASRFRSMTTRTPLRLDSSRISLTPSILLSLAASAIFSTRPFLPTW